MPLIDISGGSKNPLGNVHVGFHPGRAHFVPLDAEPERADGVSDSILSVVTEIRIGKPNAD
jgi:hypothetical protein